MAKTRSMTRNQKHDDDEASSSRKRPKTYAPWSDLHHDVLYLVMLKLGFGDYYSLRGVCKSWRLLAHSIKNRFITSMPPMSITISTDSNEKICCYLEDFDGRKFKTIFPDFAGGGFIGSTCGHLIFFSERTRDFWLVNPITRNQLHFPHFPSDYLPGSLLQRAILVSSPSISGVVFVVLSGGKILFSIEGKGEWKHVSYGACFCDLYAFKGKIYSLSAYDIIYPVVHDRARLFELKLNPDPEFSVLETRNPSSSEFISLHAFISLDENLYVIGWNKDYQNILGEVDLGEMKWVVPCKKTTEKYAFFCSNLTGVVVAVKRESWADPRSLSRIRSFSLGGYDSFYDTDKYRKYDVFNAYMWYFPHESMDVDHIKE